MKITRCQILAFVFVTAVPAPASAQVAYALQHSIPAPATIGRLANDFATVKVDGNYLAAGAAGVVKVFDATSGALLFVLANPGLAADDQYFGSSLAISGTRVVVGVSQYATDGFGIVYIYDLSSATPTVPAVTLNNPAPAAFDNFGNVVAISGTRVVVGASGDDAAGSNAGSVYVYDLSSATPAVPVVTLNKPMPAAGDNFGGSVAISGTRLVVGAYLDDTGANNAGSAYVFDLSSGTPTVPVVTLHNPSPAVLDIFGTSVAISGTRVVVAAIQDDTGAANAGSAYVYDLSSATPAVPVATLNNPSPAVDDFFAGRVAVSGTRVVVGASRDDTGATDAGSAYVYDLSSGTPTVPVFTLNNPVPAPGGIFGSVDISGARVWVAGKGAYGYDLSSAAPTVPVTTLHIMGLTTGDNFGVSIAVSGTRVVVGAAADNTGAEDAGSVFVYDLSSASPLMPVATFHNPSPVPNDYFGNSVAISGTWVVIGAPADGTSTGDAGSAYVYDLSSATPTLPVLALDNPGLFTSPDSHLFGASVAIDGTRVVVGVPYDDTGGLGTGRAYVYDLSSVTPTVPVVAMDNPSAAEYDRFGNSVAISGTRVVVGAHESNFGAIDSGRAYVFDLGDATPAEPVLTLNNPSPATGDRFGHSVAISGTRVVVGASGADAGAADAGSVYVYDLSSGTPTVPVATLSNPGPATGDLFGYAVAIDGTTIAIGTPNDDTVALDKGSAYIFGAAVLPTNTPPVIVGPFTYEPGIGTFRFSLSLVTNYTYRVQTTKNLSVNPIVWEDLTNFFATDPLVAIVDRSATNAMRFYRAVTP